MTRRPSCLRPSSVGHSAPRGRSCLPASLSSLGARQPHPHAGRLLSVCFSSLSFSPIVRFAISWTNGAMQLLLTEVLTFSSGRRYRAFAFTLFGMLIFSLPVASNAFRQSTLLAPLTCRHAYKRARQSQRVNGAQQQQRFVRSTCVLLGTTSESPLTHPTKLDQCIRRHGGTGIPVGAVQIEASRIQPFKDLIHRVMRQDVPLLKNGNMPKINLAFRGVEKFVGPSTFHQAHAPQAAHASVGSTAGTSIKPKRRKQVLVHLPTIVASALDDGHPELTHFLQANHIPYLPGLRRHRSHPEATRARKHAMLSTYVAPKPKPSPSHDDKVDTLPTFTYTELFAGIGGFRLGLDAIGGKCVLANEIDPYAAAIYRRNFSMNGHDANCPLVEADILDLCPTRDAIPKDVDILCAGFPCQAFSARGDQLALADTDRGQLYRELCRMLCETSPKSFIFENVVGLVTMEGGYVGRDGNQSTLRAGKVFNHVISEFEKCGYSLTWNVVNAANFLPQRRKRVYIVGIRNDITAKFSWDWYDDIVGDDKKKDSRVLRDVLAEDVSDAYQLTASQFETVRRIHGKAFNQRAILDIQEKAPTLISSYRKTNSMTTKYIMEEADGTARSVPRFLTPRECLALQGFPDWIDVPSAGDSEVDHAHFYKGMGNAVCPPLIERIGQELVRCLLEASRPLFRE